MYSTSQRLRAAFNVYNDRLRPTGNLRKSLRTAQLWRASTSTDRVLRVKSFGQPNYVVPARVYADLAEPLFVGCEEQALPLPRTH